MATKNTKTTAPAKQEAPAQSKPKKEKTARFGPIEVGDRLSWIEDNARPAVSRCLCGCKETTKGRFFPGHDATLKEELKATVRAGGEAAPHARAILATFGW